MHAGLSQGSAAVGQVVQPSRLLQQMHSPQELLHSRLDTRVNNRSASGQVSSVSGGCLTRAVSCHSGTRQWCLFRLCMATMSQTGSWLEDVLNARVLGGKDRHFNVREMYHF